MVLVQALLTALLSGAFSGALLFALNERRDRAEISLQKLERIYLLVSEWVDLTRDFYSQCWGVASGEIPLARASAQGPAARNAIDAKWAEASMLIYIYHNELSHLLIPLLAGTKPLVEVRRAVFSNKIEGNPPDMAVLNSIGDHMNEIVAAQTPLFLALSHRGRNIARRPHLFEGISRLRARLGLRKSIAKAPNNNTDGGDAPKAD